MQIDGGVEVYIHAFLTLELDGDGWLASRLGRFSPGKNPGTHWIGGWVDPRAGLDVVAKRKVLPCRESNPGCRGCNVVTTATD
jgi:hypothetical protein